MKDEAFVLREIRKLMSDRIAISMVEIKNTKRNIEIAIPDPLRFMGIQKEIVFVILFTTV